MKTASYYLVSHEVIPDAFARVVEAKRMLADGRASSASEASRLAGISRSVFYKYRDCVHAYDGKGAENIITLYVILRDKAGVLSSLIATLSQAGGNILTVNQNIPSGGYAAVSVSLRTEGLRISVSDLIAAVGESDGVKRIENIQY